MQDEAAVRSWLTDLVDNASNAALQRSQDFLWTPSVGASGAEIALCEKSCGVIIAPSHRSILRITNGATFVYTHSSGSELSIALLSTTDIARLAKELKELTALLDDNLSNLPERQWGGLIPVFDIMNSEYLISDDDHQESGEHMVLLGWMEASVDEWRNFKYADSVAEALERIFKTFTDTGEILQFW